MSNDPDRTRRGLLAAIVGGVTAGGVLSPIRSYLDGFAPLSGGVWDETQSDRRTLQGPHGAATVRTDGYGVPHISADSEAAAYYATGYVQAADRLFQLDLQRRQMRGQLSEVVGPDTVSSDEFYLKMCFDDAASATWNALEGTRVGELIQAYVDGVNARISEGKLPPEFGLLGFEPRPWTPADTLLMEKQISWTLTGSFRTLRKALVAETLGTAAADELYPDRLDHDAPILRNGTDRPAGAQSIGASKTNTHQLDAALVNRLSEFESPPGIGSNSWIVSGEHTESGEPILANDPHLLLQAPPIWYEQHIETGDINVRGVTFPGVPFVIIGATETASWGFTNAGADVIDFYTYESDGDEYRYRDGWRSYETEERRLRVAGATDRTVTRRRTVHGPIIEEHGSEVAVAWTGFGATRTTEAIHEYTHSDEMDSFLQATSKFDLPTQCLVYADTDGNTFHYVTGRVPIRQTDGEPVAGNQIFDGSAGEGEWDGYRPFDRPNWDGSGFIPFEEMPHVINPEAIGTANQRIIDDSEYPYYFAESYSAPYRGIRLYEMLDERIDSDQPVTPAFMREMHRDTVDLRVQQFVPMLSTTISEESPLREHITLLENWDGRMDRAEEAALLFDYFIRSYRELLFSEQLAEIGLPESYPTDWVIAGLDPESEWFDDRSRAELLEAALQTAVDRLTSESAAVYGDVNTTGEMTHPFGLSFLNYPSYPTDGSPATLMNYRRTGVAGSSWRMIWSPDGTAEAIAPGGNSGRYFSAHYHDQLKQWADGEYKPLSLTQDGDVRFQFGGEQ